MSRMPHCDRTVVLPFLLLLIAVSAGPRAFAQRAADARAQGGPPPVLRTRMSNELGGVINRYARLDRYDTSANSGLYSGPGPLVCNELVLVVQLTGAQISTAQDSTFGSITDAGSVGLYEFTRVRDITGTTLSFSPPLRNRYDFSGAVAIVSVPQHPFTRIVAPVTAMPFNGATGGIVALVADTVQLDADIDVSASGFPGGAKSCTGDTANVLSYVSSSTDCVAGLKGGGIAYLGPSLAAGRGASANGGGGGNALGAGGAGGGGGGNGGDGGWQRNDGATLAVGGRGGFASPFGTALAPRIMLGGGGGGGHQRDGSGTSGARGGGLVFIVARVLLARSHKIIADGEDLSAVAGTDGAGGGGAGGSICLAVDSIQGIAYLSAQGGKGGDVDNGAGGALCHGPGGGGAGGAIWHSGTALPSQVVPILAGGSPGLNITHASPCLDSTYGARRGQDGIILTDLPTPDPGAPIALLAVSLPDTVFACPDSCVDLAASIDGGTAPYTVRWDPPWQLSDPANALTRACPDATTTYTVTVGDGLSCAVSARVTVVVHPRLSPVIARTDDTLTAFPAGQNYAWYYEGSLLPAETGQRVVVKQFGRYAVTVTPPYGCPVTSAELDVQRAPLTVALRDSLFLCPDSCVVLSTVVHGGAKPYRYSWFPGLGLSASNVPSPRACPQGPTRYQVTVTDSVGSVTTASVVVTPWPRVAPGITRVGNTLTAQPAGAVYQWFRDGVPLPGATARSITVEYSGMYTVQTRSTQGCAELSPPEDVRIAMVVLLPNELRVCIDSCVTLRPQIIGGRPPFTFSWTPAATLQTPNDSVTVACPDVDYTYLLTVTDADLVRSSAAVTVSIYPAVTPTLTQRGDTLFASPPAVAWRWFAGSTELTGEKKSWMIPRTSGTYRVEITTAAGCKGTSADADVTVSALVLIMPDSMRICPDSCVLLEPYFAGGTRPYTFAWSPPSAMQNPADSSQTVCPKSTSTYTLTVTDGGGLTRSGDVVVLVWPRVFPAILRFGDTLVATPPGYAYRWFRDGAALAGETQQSLTALQSGSYTVEVTGPGACSAWSAPFDVGVRMIANLVDTVRVCPDSCVTLTPSVRGGLPPYAYRWSPAATLSSATDSMPRACPASTTTYALAIIDMAGDTVSLSSTVLVFPRLLPAIVRSGDTLRTVAAASWQWYRNGQPIAGATAQSHLLRDVGVYMVEVRSADGCPETSPPFDVPRVPLNIAFLQTSFRLCPDSCAHPVGSVGGGFPPYTVSWTPVTHVSDPASLTPSICTDADEIYTMKITDAIGDTTSLQISLLLVPRVFPTISRNGDVLSAQPAGMTYQWLLNGSPIAGATQQSLLATQSGRYTVAVTSPDGCPSASPPLDVTVLSVTVAASVECPPNALFAPGQRVTIPVRLSPPPAFATSGINGVELWLHARGGVLAPVSGASIASSRKGTWQQLRAARDVIVGSTADIVIPLDFIALLGDTACTRLVLDSVTWRGGSMTVARAVESCDICVEACGEGGERRFNGSTKAGQLRNHPDPFNSSTTIEYTVLENGPYTLWLEDALGRRRLLLAEGRDGIGDHRVVLERRDLPSGMYFCVLQTQSWFARKKMIVLN